MRQILISVLFATFGYSLAVQVEFDKTVESCTAADGARAKVPQLSKP